MVADKAAFPSIADLAAALRGHKGYIEDDFVDEPGDTPGIDVRLQVQGGGWALRTGDSSYDTDHRGYWGAGYLTRRTNCRDLARDLIDQAKNDAAECGE